MDRVVITAGGERPARTQPGTWAAPLLPNQPSNVPSVAQAALTERYLLPSLPELHACFLAVRQQLDPTLQRVQPVKLGKPYPLGQCLEITLAVQKHLRSVQESSLQPDAAVGLRALRAFLNAGGVFRQVWGDLRGEFFQNAFQLGALYVDVSNDTVTPTKPKVEILPFADANFAPITDFHHFARIAERYWKSRLYPNHVLPELAPYFPWVAVDPQGAVRLCEATDYMLALATLGRFESTEAVLREPAMPVEVFDVVARAMQGLKFVKLAGSAESGRTQALRLCREYRAKRWHQSQGQSAKAFLAVRQVNMHLAQWSASANCPSVSLQPEAQTPPQNAPSRAIIKIDNIDYDTGKFSSEAKQQLEMLVATEERLSELQRDLAIAQTARNVYALTLRALLPTTPEVESPKGDS